NNNTVASNVTATSSNLTAPTSVGNFTVEIVAVDTSGNSLGVSDSISLIATDTVIENIAPNAAFSTTNNQLTVNFDASASNDPDNGPQALSYSWNFGDGSSSGNGASPSHTYTASGTYTVTLTVSDGQDTDGATEMVVVSTVVGGGNCEYIIDNEWSTGFVATVRISNTGSSAINGWQVSWQYAPGTDRSNGWNATVVGSNPYTATPLSWNNTIQPGQSVEFGMQGTKPANGTADVPVVTGAVCD
ncbi:MAG: cellulose binding domain-containing protein, partial [Arenicella sp.]|nr:cellulose binding domain-containing protein [Arenicella sp.]